MISIINTYLDDYIAHWHNRMESVKSHIMVLVVDGKVHYKLNNEALTAVKGDLLVIPSGTCREGTNDANAPHQKYAVAFQISEPIDLPLFTRGKHTLLRPRRFDYFKERISLLHRHMIEKRPYYKTICIGILLEVLGNICRDLNTEHIPYRKARFARMIEQYILDHYRESISLEQLAKLIGRSPNYTVRLFREATGQTPLEYMHQLRITAAMDLLQNTDLSVSAISEHLGYYDSSYFYRVFRRTTGMSPSDYAAQHSIYRHR